jgi:hypothetical protein
VKPITAKNPIKAKVVAAFKKKFNARKITGLAETEDKYVAICYGEFDSKERSYKALGAQVILKKEVV